MSSTSNQYTQSDVLFVYIYICQQEQQRITATTKSIEWSKTAHRFFELESDRNEKKINCSHIVINKHKHLVL